jgi:hypothetical protein
MAQKLGFQHCCCVRGGGKIEVAFMRKGPSIVREYSTGGFINNQKGDQPVLCRGEGVGGFWPVCDAAGGL